MKKKDHLLSFDVYINNEKDEYSGNLPREL